MKSKYLYSRKGDVFVWESKWIRLEYSNPNITLFDDDAKCCSMQDILYYYYTVQLFAKKWCDDQYQWCQIARVRTHDFPSIQYLLAILKDFLGQKEPDERWSRFSWGKQEELYRITDYTDQIRSEDFYELTKNLLPAYHDEWYTLYIGCSQGELRDTTGIRLTDLQKGDLIQLKRCLEKFLKFSIDNYNDTTQRFNTSRCQTHKCMNKKLYTYHLQYTKEPMNAYTVDYNQIHNIYAVGDTIDIKVLRYDGDYFFTESYYKETIARVTKQEIFFKSGKTVALNSILYIDEKLPEKKLYYNPQQIAVDFLILLSDAEKVEFYKLTTEELLFKYGTAIANRTRMYRDEHAFPTLHEDRFENIRLILQQIICDIKNRI